MDKDEVKRILAPYCPPLSLSQVEAIAEEIVQASMKTFAIPESEVTAKPVRSKSLRKS